MFDVAASAAGAQVVLATASDDKFPPENMIDGKTDTFWISTGLFPQEVIIKFTALMNLKSIELHCYNVKSISFETTEFNEPEKFQPITEKVLESTDSHLQVEEIPCGNIRAQYLRLVINSGYDHFVSLHKLVVSGDALHS